MSIEKVLLITDSFPPSNDATSKINETICKSLSEKFEVEVLCPYESNVNKDKLNQANLLVKRIPLLFQRRKNMLLKIIKFMFFSISLSIQNNIYNCKNSIIIIHSSPPILIPLFGIYFFISRIFFKKNNLTTLIIHDLYPDILLHFKFVKNNKLIYKLISLIYKLAYKQYDLLFPCSDSIKDRLIKFYKIKKEKINIIYCWSLIPENMISELNNLNSNLKEIKNPDLIILGNIGILHLEDYLVKFLKNLLNKKHNTKLQLYIRGSQSSHFLNQIKNLKNVYTNELLPVDKIITAFNKPTLTIVSLSYESSLCAFPSRITTALSVGSPIIFITDKIQDNPIADFISKNKIGETIQEVNKKAKCEEVYEKISLNYNSYRENSLICYKKYFSINKNLLNLQNLFIKYF